MGNKCLVIITGLVIGILALMLTSLGNPVNMGICIACFLRDTVGGLGLHRAEVVQYLRPEIMGIILGAFLISLKAGEFRTTGGSSSLTRFVLGFVMMIGMLIFLGCPLRLALRLGSGDLNALWGFAGLFTGVAMGTVFLKNGFNLGKFQDQPKTGGYIFPVLALLLLVFVYTKPAFIFFSAKGPGSLHASLFASLAAGLIIGFLAQRSSFCLAGGLRDVILFRNFHLMWGFLAIFAVVLVGNLATGKFNLGFAEQPIAHTESLWNFLGMALAGWSAVLLGGCPLRQLVLAAEGNSDSAITVLGLAAGAAFAHNFGLAASPKGVPVPGMWAVALGFAIVLAISFASTMALQMKERGEINAKS